MKIILSPIASDHTSVISVNGDTLIYNGESFDFSIIQDGQQAEPLQDSPASDIIKRIDGQIEITLQYHYDSCLAEQNQSTNWDDYTFVVEDGKVPCPIKWKPKIEEQEIQEDALAEQMEEIV